jgi:medium-chain acyl-[acyl-carrier-protein] hydrolase
VGGGIEVCAVVPPGRDHRWREQPYRVMSALTDAVVEAIWPWLDRPFALFGHSLGAAVAYEIACRLDDAGRAPAHLFVAGRRAPQAPPTAPPLANLADVALLCEVQKRYGPIPAAVLAEPELIAMFLPTLRADLQVNEEYRGVPYPLSCAVSAFGGTDDATTTTEELDQWAVCTRVSFERHLLPGKHFFINDARSRLLSLIEQRLRSVPSSGSRVAVRAGMASTSR